jgi:hypothetical protein
MKRLASPLIAALGMVITVSVIAITPQMAIADVEQRDRQAAPFLADAQHSDPLPETPSGDVRERSLAQVAPGIGGTTAPPTKDSTIDPPEGEPFKCNVKTSTCSCTTVADCNFMRRVIGRTCAPPDTCTKNCKCTYPHLK